jgi:ParB family chromosome partitioning protein
MSQKPGLGRNLAAERAARKAATQQARLVPQGLPTVHPDRLMPSPENGRKKLLKIEELAATLRTDGMNTAMTVVPPDVYTAIYPQHKDAVDRRVAEGILFVVHHGHRRLAAAKAAGLTEVPILVRNDVPSLRIAAIQENLQRMGLNPIEEGVEFQAALSEKDGTGRQLSQRELARRVGCSQTYVSHRVALLRLLPQLRQAVVDHWLKEQRIEDADVNGDVNEQTGDERLLLPVREAATVYARLHPDMQEAYLRGELTASQAAMLSKMPTGQQAIPSGAAAADDCGAITQEPAAGPQLPEPRAEETGPQGPEPTPRVADGPRQPRVQASHFQTAAGGASAPEMSAPTSSVATAEEPRGVIVVRTVDELAGSIKELLDQNELEELAELLTS